MAEMTEYEVGRYITEMQAIEAFLYESVDSQWTTLPELSLMLSSASEAFTLNGIRIDGFQAEELVKYFFLGFYRKVQMDYDKPNFSTEILDVIERSFPDRSEFQIAVVKDPNDSSVWRVRKRLFRRLVTRL